MSAISNAFLTNNPLWPIPLSCHQGSRPQGFGLENECEMPTPPHFDAELLFCNALLG
jgi:hypothetical protein